MITALDPVHLPPFRDTRIMMMPFYTDDVVGSLPRELQEWAPVVHLMSVLAPAGTGYLTIDEAYVRKGETHRRPGLHVDGVGPDGGVGGWGPHGTWAGGGMTMVSSHVGCRAWDQEFSKAPGPNGDCSHLVDELDPTKCVTLEPGRIYWCSAMTVHEAMPMPRDTCRQFCRVSFPSSAPWYEGYTRNPLGIPPAGPIHPPRSEFMAYRP